MPCYLDNFWNQIKLMGWKILVVKGFGKKSTIGIRKFNYHYLFHNTSIVKKEDWNKEPGHASNYYHVSFYLEVYMVLK